MRAFGKDHPFIPAWVFAGVMFIGCSVPVDKIAKISESHPILSVILSDSFLHFCMFGLLGWLICHGYYKPSRPKVPYIKIFFYGDKLWDGDRNMAGYIVVPVIQFI